MRMTVVYDDKVVVIDGVTKVLPTLDNSNNYHALQWYGNYGELEYKNNNEGLKPQNTTINNLNDFQYIIELFDKLQTE